MKKLITILFLLLALVGFGQDIKPITPITFKALQSPTFSYDLNDSTVWIFKGTTYGWTQLGRHKNDIKAVSVIGDNTKTVTLTKFGGGTITTTFTDNSNDVVSGGGMDFITNTPVTLGTPSTVNGYSTNIVTATSHTHKLDSIPTSLLTGTISATNVVGCTSDTTTTIIYGYLYNNYAAKDSRQIFSEGWHLVSYAEINTLIAYSGVNGADKLKTPEHSLSDPEPRWTADPAMDYATNSLGLNIVGSGQRWSTGSFVEKHEGWYAWNVDNSGYTMLILYNYRDIFTSGTSLTFGLALRGIKDDPNTWTEGDLYVGNDGKKYKTVKIGTQVWIAENLAETKYRNGDWIHGFDGGVYTPISNSAWSALTTGAMCAYNDLPNDALIQVITSKTICEEISDIKDSTNTKEPIFSKGDLISGEPAITVTNGLGRLVGETATLTVSSGYQITTTGQVSDITHTNRTALDAVTNVNTGDNATNTTSNAYADAKVSDVTYSGTWNGVTTIAPSKDKVYKQIESMLPINYCATIMTVTYGTLIQGTVADLCAVGGTDVIVQEASGVNPSQINFTFSGVNRVDGFKFYGQYNGGASHNIHVEAYNYTTSTWDYLGEFGMSTIKQWYLFRLNLSNNYLSSNTVQVRIVHQDNGIPTHQMILDYVNVNYGGGGGTGFITASAVENIPNGNIAATNVQAAINELDAEKEPILTKGNLTESVTGLQFDNTRQVIGGAADLSLTSGYGIPTTTQISQIHASGSDNQTLSTTSSGTTRTVTISLGNSIGFDIADNDNNSTNEIQDLSLSGNILSLSSDATTVDISTATAVAANTAKVTNATHTGDATGATALTLATVNSNIGTYNNVTINAKGLATAGSNVAYLTSEVDGSTTNEIQAPTISGDNIGLTLTSTTISISGKEDKSNKVTSLSGSSTDVQYPSAKLTYDQLALKQPLLTNPVTANISSLPADRLIKATGTGDQVQETGITVDGSNNVFDINRLFISGSNGQDLRIGNGSNTNSFASFLTINKEWRFGNGYNTDERDFFIWDYTRGVRVLSINGSTGIVGFSNRVIVPDLTLITGAFAGSILGGDAAGNVSHKTVNQAIGGDALSGGYLSYWGSDKLYNSPLYYESYQSKIKVENSMLWVTGLSGINSNVNGLGIWGGDNGGGIYSRGDNGAKSFELYNTSGTLRLENNGTIKISSLSGTGTRIVTAASDGTLGAITNGSDGQVMTMVSGSPVFATLSTDIFNEVPNETPNSSIISFTVDYPIVSNTARIYLNGIRQAPTINYTVSGSIITFTTAPITNDVILIDYKK